MREKRVKAGFVSVTALANAFGLWRVKRGAQEVAVSTLHQWERFGNPSLEGARDLLAFLEVKSTKEVLDILDTIQRNPRSRYRPRQKGEATDA
jgi:hypothetical protein